MAVIPGQAVTAYPLPDEELSPTSKNAVSNEAVCDGIDELKNTLNHKADVIYDTASGDIASFPDGADGLPVKDLTVGIEPVQSGTGDPSPTNVRPISGWTGCNISHSGADTSDPTVISISWQSEAGTVYGGMLDVTSGVLTVTMASVDFGTLTWTYNSTKEYFSSSVSIGGKEYGYWVNSNAKCSNYAVKSRGNVIDGKDEGSITINISAVYVHDSRYTDAATFKSAMSGVQLVYELAAPQTYQLTPQEIITTLLGQNNIWSDTGSSTVEYLADTKLYIDKKLAALVAALS